ncbi:ubiquitin thioesterase OTU1-like [Tubulanus polymorphus]|uniref:ubiquitin thioesterase OTU1-like n=1 Tax=Tubulanus polymorphus TaxID=672921 RepID=UPI003DA43AA0
MASTQLLLRCKAKTGQYTIKNLTTMSTVDDLKENIAQLTNINRDCLKLRSGFPPKLMDTQDGKQLLSTLSIRYGDTIIVEEDRSNKTDTNTLNSNFTSVKRETIVRKVVPANNSCLFTSVFFVMEGRMDLSCAPHMRELIAGVVLSDPEMYNEAILEKSNSEYCNWIMSDETWGGAIEVSILSKCYGVEIDVIDTQTVRVDRFGENMNYSKRVLLIYDGIHYDPLVLESDGKIVGFQFSTNDDKILALALEFAAQAKASRQYTDVTNFTLRCLICQKALKGQVEAQQHAQETRHINFGEF